MWKIQNFRILFGTFFDMGQPKKDCWICFSYQLSNNSAKSGYLPADMLQRDSVPSQHALEALAISTLNPIQSNPMLSFLLLQQNHISRRVSLPRLVPKWIVKLHCFFPLNRERSRWFWSHVFASFRTMVSTDSVSLIQMKCDRMEVQTYEYFHGKNV